MRAEDEDGELGLLGVEAAEHLGPVEVGQAEVEDDGVEAALAGQAERLLARHGLGGNRKAGGLAQRGAEPLQDHRVVVDEEDVGHGVAWFGVERREGRVPIRRARPSDVSRR